MMDGLPEQSFLRKDSSFSTSSLFQKHPLNNVSSTNFLRNNPLGCKRVTHCEKGGLMHLLNVSTHVSLRNPHLRHTIKAQGDLLLCIFLMHIFFLFVIKVMSLGSNRSGSPVKSISSLCIVAIII